MGKLRFREVKRHVPGQWSCWVLWFSISYETSSWSTVSVCPWGQLCAPKLTFWHSINVHVKAQHEAAQPIGHAWPHHGHCKQDTCNRKPGLVPSGLASLHRSGPAQPPLGRSSPSPLLRPWKALQGSSGPRVATEGIRQGFVLSPT